MKRTTKRRLSQAAAYVVMAAIVVVVLLLVDWPTVRKNFFVTTDLGSVLKDLVTIGARNTIVYTAVAFVGGLALAVALALAKLSPFAVYRWAATVYIEFFRGLPALIVIIGMGFGVPIAFGWTPPGGTIGAGIMALILVSGAYMAETLRAGIQAVPKGQTEAARSLGMGPAHTMVSVILPQAFRIVIPPLTNEFVLLLKDTSLLFVLGVLAGQRELTALARDMMASGSTAGTSTSLTYAALLYLIITLPLTQLVAWLERRQQRAR